MSDEEEADDSYDQEFEDVVTSVEGDEEERSLTTILFIVALIIIALVMFGVIHN